MEVSDEHVDVGDGSDFVVALDGDSGQLMLFGAGTELERTAEVFVLVDCYFRGGGPGFHVAAESVAGAELRAEVLQIPLLGFEDEFDARVYLRGLGVVPDGDVGGDVIAQLKSEFEKFVGDSVQRMLDVDVRLEETLAEHVRQVYRLRLDKNGAGIQVDSHVVEPSGQHRGGEKTRVSLVPVSKAEDLDSMVVGGRGAGNHGDEGVLICASKLAGVDSVGRLFAVELAVIEEVDGGIGELIGNAEDEFVDGVIEVLGSGFEEHVELDLVADTRLPIVEGLRVELHIVEIGNDILGDGEGAGDLRGHVVDIAAVVVGVVDRRIIVVEG